LVPGDYVSVWAFDEGEWVPVGNENVPEQWAETLLFNHLISYRGHLLVGVGGYPPGNASVWALAGRQWVQIAGGGVMESWDGALQDAYSFEFPYRMAVHEGDLFVGFGNNPGMAQVWRFTPDRW
jgi:hypothetical protein